MMGLGTVLHRVLRPVLEGLGPRMPGEVFPAFFEMEMLQRALIASVLVTVVAGLYGTYLMLRNLSLIGDGLAHVSFGGAALGVALGAVAPLDVALLFSIVASVIIYELQNREILSGDTSIAIFLTGMLAFGLVVLRLWGDGITTDIEGYLFGSLILIDDQSLDRITTISAIALVGLALCHRGLLAMTIDSVAARVQGLPVHLLGLWFSVSIAMIVVSMVQVIGALLVTALLVTPAATAQLISRSFRGSLLWTQAFGLTSTLVGLYLSSELNTGSGSMIAVVAAAIFASVGLGRLIYSRFQSMESGTRPVLTDSEA
ncbi:MAG TPA: metal ABC transporter permease [Candidatus Poseidoniaceae archaeon]|nr:MAG TPA: metal ABC transporter permease [Candidatus Poseidoniales archaeon]HIH53949.1 metal ABC transporter permease [Candidatus Poseidoniaceae archaeon]